MIFFKATFFICVNLLSMSSIIICSSRRIVQTRKQIFETPKITNELISSIKIHKDWSDKVKIHLLEHLAWNPNLFLKDAKDIPSFTLQLQEALRPFGKSLPQNYNGEGSLPIFSDSTITLPIIECQNLKKTIDIICAELRTVKVTGLDRKIEVLRNNIEKLNALGQPQENINFTEIIQHQNSIRKNFNRLLGFVDEKRMYIKDVQVLEKDIERVIALQKCIQLKDEPTNEAIEKTIQDHRQYRDNIIKEAEKALVGVQKEGLKIIPNEIVQKALTTSIVISHTEFGANYEKLIHEKKHDDLVVEKKKTRKDDSRGKEVDPKDEDEESGQSNLSLNKDGFPDQATQEQCNEFESQDQGQGQDLSPRDQSIDKLAENPPVAPPFNKETSSDPEKITNQVNHQPLNQEESPPKETYFELFCRLFITFLSLLNPLRFLK